MMIKCETSALTCMTKTNYLNIPFAGFSYVSLFQALLRTKQSCKRNLIHLCDGYVERSSNRHTSLLLQGIKVFRVVRNFIRNQVKVNLPCECE